MNKPLEDERKQVKKAVSALGDLVEALKTAQRGLERGLDEEAPAVLDGLASATRAIRTLRRLPATLESLEPQLSALRTDTERAYEKSRARLVAELDERLRQGHGLRLEGRLPKLSCGPLVLELAGGSKPEVRIHYGPQIALLDTVPVDAEKVAQAVASQLGSLEKDARPDEQFLDELCGAWRCAVARLDLGHRDKAPIIGVLAELAAGRQQPGWRADPVRTAYRSYSRVQFSHDLARLRVHRTGDHELVLTVATRDQTRRPADHLWVSGTHYAYLAFRKVPADE